MSFVISACSVLQLNEERLGKKVVATVTYTAENGHDTLTKDITRYQLIQAVNRVLNQYYSYGYTLPTDMVAFFDETLEQLCDYQLVVMAGIDYLSQKKSGVLNSSGKWNGQPYGIYRITEWDNYTYEGTANSGSYESGSLLTYAEYDKAIKNVNTQYESLFKEYLTTVEAEQAAKEAAKADSDTDTETEEETPKTLDARPVKLDSEEETFIYDSTVDSLTKRFDADEATIDEFTGRADEDRTEQDRKNRKDAWKRTQKALEEAYVTYDYLLNESLDSMLIYEFKRSLTEGVKGTLTDSVLQAYLEKTATKNQTTYKKITDYISAIQSSYDGIFYHKATEGYFYVKNLVVTFDTVTADYIASVKKNFKEPEKSEAFQAVLKGLADGIKVNVSNIFYDPDDDSKLFYKADDFFTAAELTEIEALKTTVKDNTNAELLALIDANKTDGRYIFKLSAAVGTDKTHVVTGLPFDTLFTFYKADMKAVEDSRSTTYAGDDFGYTKAILEAFDTWFYALNDDGSQTFNAASDYFIYKDNKDYSKLFLELGVQLYENGLGGYGGTNAVGNYYLNYDATSSYEIIDGSAVYYKDKTDTDPLTKDNVYAVITEFGIHILIVTYVPFVDGVDTANTDGSGVPDGSGVLSLDHILNYYKDDKTVREYIKELVQTELEDEAYFKYYREILSKKEGKYKTYPKRYKDLTKTA
jgi:hypothetical protein